MTLGSIQLLPFMWIGWSLICSDFRFSFGAPAKQREYKYTSAQLSRPCWETEEFTVQQECFECSDYQKKTELECKISGFVEKIKCKLGQDEYRNCRSVSAEELKFWKFEGCVLSLGMIFAFIVLIRQRALDRRAENKVRRQIEGI
ncbi:protein JTB-like [Polypterus senegalus]|uniref:protein JTB-like n=1 Tax=Polypterus senegalus TaxID=55291 RepID=UPI00196237ED|nr:protein JTB-like [Polypterus senegalus]